MAPCQKIEVVSAEDMTQQFFMEHYFNTRTPVIVKGASSNWVFMKKWTKDYLSTEMGDFQCKIVKDSRPYHSKEQCSLKEYFQNYAHLSTLTFTSFDSENEPLPLFLKDISLPNPFFSKKDIEAYFFFHANEIGGTLPHCHMDAFNMLQYGTKRWVMYDADPEIAPKGWEMLKQCHKDYGTGTFSRDWFVDGPEQVRQAGITLYECEQQAGDIVYIPERFSHAVLNLTRNQGMVVIAKRPGKVFKKDVGGGYSPQPSNAEETIK